MQCYLLSGQKAVKLQLEVAGALQKFNRSFSPDVYLNIISKNSHVNAYTSGLITWDFPIGNSPREHTI